MHDSSMSSWVKYEKIWAYILASTTILMWQFFFQMLKFGNFKPSTHFDMLNIAEITNMHDSQMRSQF